MTATGLATFDRTLHATNGWLQEIMEDLGPDRQVAWHSLGGVLRALRDRLPLDLAVHLGEQLPLLVRGTYYGRWQPSNQPVKSRSLEEFLEPIGREFDDLRPVNVEDATRSVFRVLSLHMDRGELENVRQALPEEVRRLWPDEFLQAAPAQGKTA